MAMTEWIDTADFEEFLASKSPGFIFKHSTRCPTSAEIHDEIEAFAGAHPALPIFLVRVIESRPVSNAIAERLKVEHQSPQAILVDETGAAAWTASHREISAGAIERAWLEKAGAKKA